MSSVWSSMSSGDRVALTQSVEGYWSDAGDTLATYSVRAGFDLLLQAIDLQEGDEIIFSAINIKGMAKIARDHGAVCVPLDLDVESLAPSAEDLRRVVTPRSRVLVVAHLFGALIDLDDLFREAERLGLVIVEDCAQAFDGRAFEGHPLADLSMFSFGPLKTSTALGGGLIRVRAPGLLKRMKDIQETYPIQKDSVHLKRTFKFMMFKLATNPIVFGVIYKAFRILGRDYDDAIGEQVRNIAPQGKSNKFRKRPALALLKLLKRRLYTYREGEMDAREAYGQMLIDLVGDAVVFPGAKNPHHNYWMFPILADDPERFIAELKKRGFDSSGWLRSKTIPAPDDRLELDPVVATQALSDMVFVPCYPSMPQREIAREAQAIREIADELGSERTKGYTRPLAKVAAAE